MRKIIYIMKVMIMHNHCYYCLRWIYSDNGSNLYHEDDVSVNDENVKKRTFSLNTYHENDISVSVSRSQMKGGVVSHVGCVNSSAALDQHLHDLGVAALRSPVKRRKLMVITDWEKIKLLLECAWTYSRI
jgi:hypothetical protein